MRIPGKTDYRILAAVIGLFLILGLIAGIQTCRQIKSTVEKTVNTSIDNRLNSPSLPISIPITAHDIATKKTGDSLENNRKQLHLRIDAAGQPELQSWLDSVFNYPGGHPDPDAN